jgi:hypothetical protein
MAKLAPPLIQGIFLTPFDSKFSRLSIAYLVATGNVEIARVLKLSCIVGTCTRDAMS